MHMFPSLLGKYLEAEEPGHSRGKSPANKSPTRLHFTLQPALNENSVIFIPVDEVMVPVFLVSNRIAKHFPFFSSFLLQLCHRPLKSSHIVVDLGM